MVFQIKTMESSLGRDHGLSMMTMVIVQKTMVFSIIPVAFKLTSISVSLTLTLLDLRAVPI